MRHSHRDEWRLNTGVNRPGRLRKLVLQIQAIGLKTFKNFAVLGIEPRKESPRNIFIGGSGLIEIGKRLNRNHAGGRQPFNRIFPSRKRLNWS